MKIRAFFFILVCFLILLAGCHQGAIEHEDEYYHVKITAWEFLKEKGWAIRAKENWETAQVSVTIIDENYELLDPSYEGQEVLSVIFEDKENVIVGTPIVLVDPKKLEVIGYMFGE